MISRAVSILGYALDFNIVRLNKKNIKKRYAVIIIKFDTVKDSEEETINKLKNFGKQYRRHPEDPAPIVKVVEKLPKFTRQ